MKRRLFSLFALSALLTVSLFGVNTAFAASATVSANIAFAEPLVVTTNSNAEFGLVKASEAANYSLSTNGALRSTNGGAVVGGAHSPASLTIAGSDTQAIDIKVTNYVARHGVTPSNARCAYNGGAATSCDLHGQAAPANGKKLLIGLDVAVDGTQRAGSMAAPSFDVLVNYD